MPIFEIQEPWGDRVFEIEADRMPSEEQIRELLAQMPQEPRPEVTLPPWLQAQADKLEGKPVEVDSLRGTPAPSTVAGDEFMRWQTDYQPLERPYFPSPAGEVLKPGPKFIEDPAGQMLRPGRPERTSALGAAAAAAARSAPRAAAFAVGFKAGSPTYAAGPVVGTVASVGAGIISSMLMDKAEKEVLQVSYPEFLDYSERAAAQHPYAAFLGDVAGSAGVFELSPFSAYRNLATLPAVMRGIATPMERQMFKVGAIQAGLGAGMAAGGAITEGRFPTVGELATGAAYTTLLGKPRMRALQPTLPMPGKRGQYAEAVRTDTGQVRPAGRVAEGLQDQGRQDIQRPAPGQPQPVGAGAQEGQVLLEAVAEVGRRRYLKRGGKWYPEGSDQPLPRGDVLSEDPDQIFAEEFIATLEAQSRKPQPEAVEEPTPKPEMWRAQARLQWIDSNAAFKRRMSPPDKDLSGLHWEELTEAEQAQVGQKMGHNVPTEALPRPHVSDAEWSEALEIFKEAVAATGTKGKVTTIRKAKGEEAQKELFDTRRVMIATPEGIVLNEPAFYEWLGNEGALLKPAQRAKAIRAKVNEEFIHRHVSDPEARNYWQSLPWQERLLETYLYLGYWTRSGYAAYSGEDVTRLNMGHEAIRRRLQQLQGMTSSEIAEQVGMGRLSLEGLERLNILMRLSRERWLGRGTNQAQSAAKIIDELQRKIGSDITAARTQEPAARRRRQLDFEIWGDWNNRPHPVNPRLPTGEEVLGWLKSGFYPSEWERFKAYGAIEHFAPKGRVSWDDVNDWLDQAVAREVNERRQTTLPLEGPASRRRKQGFDPFQVPLALDPEARRTEGLPAGEPAPFFAPRATELENAAQDYLNLLEPKTRQKGVPFREDLPEGAEVPVVGPKEVERLERAKPPVRVPTYKGFLKYLRENYGDVSSSQGKNLWQEQVWKWVMALPGQTLARYRSAMDLEKYLGFGAEEPGRVTDIVDPPAPIQIQGELGGIVSHEPSRETVWFETPKGLKQVKQFGFKTAPGTKKGPSERALRAMAYRRSVEAAVAEKLIMQAIGGREFSRSKITPDEVGYNMKTTVGAYHHITPGERSNLDRLTHVVTERGRVGKNVTSSITHRVVVLRDESTGNIEVVASYMDPARKGKGGETIPAKPMIVDPMLAHTDKPHIKLADLVNRRRFTPIISVLLDDPVQGFHQHFTSMEAFNQAFGGEVMGRIMQTAEPRIAFEGRYELPPGAEAHIPGDPLRQTTVVGQEVPARPPRVARPGFLQAGGGMLQISKTTGVTPAEAEALIDHVYGEVLDVKEPADIQRAVESLELKAQNVVRAHPTHKLSWQELRELPTTEQALSARDRLAISALQKITDQFRRVYKLENEDAYDIALGTLYDLIRTHQTTAGFVQDLIRGFGVPLAERITPSQQAEMNLRRALAPTRPEPIGVSRELAVPPVGYRPQAAGFMGRRMGRIIEPGRAEMRGAAMESPDPYERWLARYSRVVGQAPTPLPPGTGTLDPMGPEYAAVQAAMDPPPVLTEMKIAKPTGKEPVYYRGAPSKVRLRTGTFTWAEKPTLPEIARVESEEAMGPMAGERWAGEDVERALVEQEERLGKIKKEGAKPARTITEWSESEKRMIRRLAPPEAGEPSERATQRSWRSAYDPVEYEKARYEAWLQANANNYPASLRRGKWGVHGEWLDLKSRMGAFVARRELIQEIAALRDGVDGLSGKASVNAREAVRLQSLADMPTGLGGPVARTRDYLAREREAQGYRAAARAVIATGETIDSGMGSMWTTSIATLREFMNDIATGQAEARRMYGAGEVSEPIFDRWMTALEKLQQEVEFAYNHWNDPRLQAVVEATRRELKEEYDFEVANGMTVREYDSYMPGRYEADFWDGQNIRFGPPRLLGRLWGEPKTFKNVYKAIAAGPYIPASYDVADLVQHRVLQGRRMVNRRMWVEQVKAMEDPVTGGNVAIEPVPNKIRTQVQNPLTGDTEVRMLPDPEHRWRVPEGKAGYELVGAPGIKPLAVMEPFVNLIEALTGTSKVPKFEFMGFPAGQALLNMSAVLKHAVVLILDTFHPSRLGWYAASQAASAGKWVASRGGYSALSFRPSEMYDAVNKGLITQDAADWALGTIPVNVRGQGMQNVSRIEVVNEMLRSGLNANRIGDALYKDAIANIPFIGPAMHRGLIGAYNRWLFDRFIPGLITESALNNFEKLHAQNPTVEVSKLMRDVVRDTNTYYGNMGRQGVFRDPTWRDVWQIILLAPMWQEGLIGKELRFFGGRLPAAGEHLARLGLRKAGFDVSAEKNLVQEFWGRSGVPPMGALGRGMSAGLGVFFLFTQLANLIQRDRGFTWKNPEPGHGMDAYIPVPWTREGGIWLSPMSLFAEVLHDVIRLSETKTKAWEALMQIGANKLGPVGKMINVLRTGETARGEYITTTPGVLSEALSQVVPFWGTGPISVTKPLQAIGHAVLPQVVPPTEPGQLQKQLIGSLTGIKTGIEQQPISDIGRLAAQYMREHRLTPDTIHMIPTDVPGYAEMRHALRIGNYNRANKALLSLMETRSLGEVVKEMREYAGRPFTGSKSTEPFFVRSLSEGQRQIYTRANLQRWREWMMFDAWLRNGRNPL